MFKKKPSKMWNTPDGREIPEENEAPAEIEVLDIEIDDDVNRWASENDAPQGEPEFYDQDPISDIFPA